MISPFMQNHTYKALQVPTPCLLSFFFKKEKYCLFLWLHQVLVTAHGMLDR